MTTLTLSKAFWYSLAFTGCFIISQNLMAHNIVSGAYVDGMVIEGEIGFSNGEMALAGTKVQVINAAGEVIDEVQIEEEGLFSYQATKAMQYIFKANLGAGHIAEINVAADEFATHVEVNTSSDNTDTKNTTISTNTTNTDPAALEAMIRSAVAQQIKPLQKELRAYKEKVMLRDIAGGLGFIIGIFGVAAWMSARKQQEKS